MAVKKRKKKKNISFILPSRGVTSPWSGPPLMWPWERLIAYLFSSATALLSLSPSASSFHPLCPPLLLLTHHTPARPAVQRHSKTNHTTELFCRASVVIPALHTSSSWAPIQHCQEEELSHDAIRAGYRTSVLIGYWSNYFPSSQYRKLSGTEAGKESLVRCILFTYSLIRVADLRLNFANLRLTYWGNLQVWLLVFGQHLTRLISQEKTRNNNVNTHPRNTSSGPYEFWLIMSKSKSRVYFVISATKLYMEEGTVDGLTNIILNK